MRRLRALGGLLALLAGRAAAACADVTLHSDGEGEISTGAGEYAADACLAWLLEPASPGEVTLSFDSFDVDSDCSADYVRVFDGSSDAGDVLLTACGSDLPASVTSTGGALLVEFVSDSFVQADGFVASYAVNYDTTLVFSDTAVSDGAGAYPTHAQLNWLVQAGAGEVVRVTLTALDIASSTGCLDDYLLVADGDSADADLLLRACGSSLSGGTVSVESSGTSAFVQFASDGTDDGGLAGFEADVELVAAPADDDGGGGGAATDDGLLLYAGVAGGVALLVAGAAAAVRRQRASAKQHVDATDDMVQMAALRRRQSSVRNIALTVSVSSSVAGGDAPPEVRRNSLVSVSRSTPTTPRRPSIGGSGATTPARRPSIGATARRPSIGGAGVARRPSVSASAETGTGRRRSLTDSGLGLSEEIVLAAARATAAAVERSTPKAADEEARAAAKSEVQRRMSLGESPQSAVKAGAAAAAAVRKRRLSMGGGARRSSVQGTVDTGDEISAAMRAAREALGLPTGAQSPQSPQRRRGSVAETSASRGGRTGNLQTLFGSALASIGSILRSGGAALGNAREGRLLVERVSAYRIPIKAVLARYSHSADQKVIRAAGALATILEQLVVESDLQRIRACEYEVVCLLRALLADVSADARLANLVVLHEACPELGELHSGDGSEFAAANAEVHRSGAGGAHVVDAADLRLGQVFATGFSGTVVRAVYQGRQVAVKRIELPGPLPPFLASEWLERLSALTAVRHPALLRYFGGCVQYPFVFEVTELRTCSLREALANQALQLAEEQLGAALEAVAQGMQACYELSPPLHHRRLDVNNVLLDDRMRATVADYGWSTAQCCLRPTAHERESVRYTAPEALAGLVFDEACDVYSFGVLCWETLARRDLYGADAEPEDVVQRVLVRHEPPPMDRTIPGPWQTLILACWSSDRGQRPTFGAVAKRIGQLRAAGGVRPGSGTMLESLSACDLLV